MIDLTDEQKKKMRELFKEYIGNNRKKKTLTADNRVALKDFIEITFETAEPEEAKGYKKEVSRYMKSKQEYSEGSEPVQEIVSVRKDHLDMSSASKEHMDALYNQKMNDERAKGRLKDANDKIIAEMRLLCDVSTDVMKTALKELEKSYNGSGSIINEAKACKDALYGIVMQEGA